MTHDIRDARGLGSRFPAPLLSVDAILMMAKRWTPAGEGPGPRPTGKRQPVLFKFDLHGSGLGCRGSGRLRRDSRQTG